ncbi:hypothetical protein QE152_g35308 [Popillia japonica]|uniref:Uncharacterized protein n=1 Tax=Popillia japonica TaxID=7064 RepID=A0AAW1IGD7_POPJA
MLIVARMIEKQTAAFMAALAKKESASVATGGNSVRSIPSTTGAAYPGVQRSEPIMGAEDSGDRRSHRGRGEATMGGDILEPFDLDEAELNVERRVSKIDQLSEIYGWSRYERAYFAQGRLKGAASMEGRIKESVSTTRRLWRSVGGIGSAAKATKRDPGEFLPCEDGVIGAMPFYRPGCGIGPYQRTARPWRVLTMRRWRYWCDAVLQARMRYRSLSEDRLWSCGRQHTRRGVRLLLSYIPTLGGYYGIPGDDNPEFIVRRNEERGGTAEGTISGGFKVEACGGRSEAGTEGGVLQFPGGWQSLQSKLHEGACRPLSTMSWRRAYGEGLP